MTPLAVNQRRARINFAIFAVAAIGAGWAGVLIDRAAGLDLANGIALSNSSGTTGLAVFILGPAVVALALYLFSRDGAGKLGFTLRFPHRTRWFAGAALLYPVITAATVGAGLAVGVASLSADPAPGKPTFFAAFGAIFAIQLVKNLFEEFIFRGYGTRTALALGMPSRLGPHLLVGVVWALWHLPLYLMWTSPADLRLISTLSWSLFFPLLVAGITASALVYGEMRARTGSLWPGLLLHSMCNAIATPLLTNGHLTFTGHADALFSPVPSSLLTLLLFALTGLLLLRRKPRTTAPTPDRPTAVPVP